MKCPNCKEEVLFRDVLDHNGLHYIECPVCGLRYANTLEVEKEFDWQSFRREAAMRAMQSWRMKSYTYNVEATEIVRDYTPEDVAKYAVRDADALIEELKKQQ